MADDLFTEENSDDGVYVLDRDTVDPVLAAVRAGDAEALVAAFEPLHAADIADLLEQVDDDTRVQLVQLYGREFDGEILSELDESVREDVIGALHPDVLAEAVRELETDDVVDLIEDLEDDQQNLILDALAVSDRVAVEQSLSYPEESAGRLMQREMVAAPEHWDVGQVIDHMRAHDGLPDQFYHVILVDPKMRPTGYVTLGRIMAAARTTPMRELTEESFRTIPVTQDEGDVAYAFNQYHLISAPVVDEDDRLVGVITIDDAMAILDEEHEEDILRLAGVGEGSLSDRAIETVRARIPWLGVNLVTAILASAVINQFETVIAGFVALAVLMPIVASMGGNAATQTMTVAVRALATRELTARNMLRVLRREVLVAFLNGMTLAVLLGTGATLWSGNPGLGVVIAMAIIINLFFAGVAGLLIPVALEKAGVDPAIASSVFVTTVTDVIGFFAFLGIAALWFGLPL